MNNLGAFVLAFLLFIACAEVDYGSTYDTASYEIQLRASPMQEPLPEEVACQDTTSSYDHSFDEKICKRSSGEGDEYVEPGWDREREQATCPPFYKLDYPDPGTLCDAAEVYVDDPEACDEECSDLGVSGPNKFQFGWISCKVTMVRNCEEEE